MGGGNVQARHTETGMVPLHEAASAGHSQVIQVLLTMNAPVNPRTVTDDVPADLAKRNGHNECVKLLRTYKITVVLMNIRLLINLIYCRKL